MDEEIVAIERTNTWSLVLFPSGNHFIGCKWVYKVKYKADGIVDRYKARIVAKGYNQLEGIDFTDTFSPVAKIVIVKILLSLVVSFGWSLAQMDINNAFLNGDLFEEVYMSLHLGYYQDTSSSTRPLVCKLNKSIYGLK